MTLHTPWTIHEAEAALYPAWRDGMPFYGPGGRGSPETLFLAKASLTISETQRHSAASAYNRSGNEPTFEADFEIAVTFPDGAMSDSLSRVQARLEVGGLHVLVVRFQDEFSGHWTCLRFFYVTIESAETATSGEVMDRSIHLKATLLQETTGTGTAPSLDPVVIGEVDWICGGRRVTCLTYDPVSETWDATPQNDTGSDGTLLVNLAPVDGCPTDVEMSAYFPRLVPGNAIPPALDQTTVAWCNLVVARIGNHASPVHHGLTLSDGITVQAAGCPEPIMALPQSRMLDEPVIVFRYLRRVYATIGHGVLAVPDLECSAPPFTHDCPFRLAIPGDPNPATDHSGLTLYPDGAWLDGTVKS